MKKKFFLLLICFALTGCNNTDAPDSSNQENETPSDVIPDEESNKENEFTGEVNYEVTSHDYLDERDYTYEHKLQKPSNIVKNIDDLEAICDYYAFYKVEKFQIKLDNYVYSTDVKDIKSELNYLYWHNELINGVIGFNAIDVGDDIWEFSYTIYHNAYKDSTPYYKAWNDLLYETPTSSRSAEYNDFATEDESKPICDVSTTQQLFYAAEHDYRINCIPGSKAERYYLKAKSLLREIVDDSMDYLTKLSTIYDYIHEKATYDVNAIEQSVPVSNPSLYPDENGATCKCYFIEGFFDNNLVVCDGFSKVYTLLGKMEGLEIVRASGTTDTKWETREIPGHAYCFVKYEGNWYLSDLTWGQYQFNGISCNIHNYFLAPHTYIDPYMSNNWTELGVINDYSDVEINPLLNYFQNRKTTYNEKTYSLVVSENNPDHIEALFNNFVISNGNSKILNKSSYIDILVTSQSGMDAVMDKIKKYGLYYDYFNDPNFPNQYEFLILTKI